MSSPAPTTAADHSEPPARRRSGARRARGLTVLAGAGAAVVGWVVAGPLAGIDLAVKTGTEPTVREIGFASVVIVGVLVGLAAWALLAAFERFTASARTAWTVTALVVFALSLLGPTGGQTTAAGVALAGLHLLVAVVLIPGLRRTARRP